MAMTGRPQTLNSLHKKKVFHCKNSMKILYEKDHSEVSETDSEESHSLSSDEDDFVPIK